MDRRFISLNWLKSNWCSVCMCSATGAHVPPQAGDLERARKILESLVQKQVTEGLWLMAEGEPGRRN